MISWIPRFSNSSSASIPMEARLEPSSSIIEVFSDSFIFFPRVRVDDDDGVLVVEVLDEGVLEPLLRLGVPSLSSPDWLLGNGEARFVPILPEELVRRPREPLTRRFSLGLVVSSPTLLS